MPSYWLGELTSSCETELGPIIELAAYKAPGPANPWQLRANAYRVLLTRGRDAHVVFVPELSCLDETYSYLVACGFRPLKA